MTKLVCKLISSVYLLSPITAGDTVCNLGIAMDELMRHQPTLKSSVITALIEVVYSLVKCDPIWCVIVDYEILLLH